MTNDSFREALELDFQDMDIGSKEELRLLMKIAGYHVKFVKSENKLMKFFPTQEQLDGAWEHLKGEQLTLDGDFWKTDVASDKKSYRSRATKDVYVRGKLYKKGQFVPMGKKIKGGKK